ncbi:MAG: ExbD/TolR family protein [Limnohabitans sp.]
MAFGRLSRRDSATPMAEINVTPLVDVMLVLLVIFMLTAPLLTSAIRLDLPSAPSAPATSAGVALRVVIDARGQVYLDDLAVPAEALAARLAEQSRLQPDTELLLRADAAVPYGQVLALVGLAQQVGLSRIGFVAQPPAAPGR